MMCRRMLPLIVAALALLGFARPSSAISHVSVIDEVATSYNGDPNFQFIEIRMLAILQNFMQNSVFAAFDSNGNYISDVLVVPGNVATGGNEQATRYSGVNTRFVRIRSYLFSSLCAVIAGLMNVACSSLKGF